MHVHISVGMPAELLTEIESNIKGKTRNAKVLACIQKGYAVLTSSQQPRSEGHA